MTFGGCWPPSGGQGTYVRTYLYAYGYAYGHAYGYAYGYAVSYCDKTGAPTAYLGST